MFRVGRGGGVGGGRFMELCVELGMAVGGEGYKTVHLPILLHTVLHKKRGTLPE